MTFAKVRPLAANRFAIVPVHGAPAAFARKQGLSRQAVLLGLRRGKLRVAVGGRIEETPDWEIPPRRPAGRPSTFGAAPGAFKRLRERSNVDVRPLYRLIKRGEIVVGEDGEFTYTPKPAPVRDRRAAILADVERYINDLTAVDLAAGQEFAHALVNHVQRRLAGWRRP
jgi:hypothetical protein